MSDEHDPATRPKPQPATGGWDAFTTGETWNGMPVAPPRSRSRPAAEPGGAAPGPATPQTPPGRPTAPGGAPTGPGTAHDTWFTDRSTAGDEAFDRALQEEGFRNARGGRRGGRKGRPTRLRLPNVGPAIITLLVISLGLLLVLSSIRWYPRIP
jgi:hypothetical protein